MIEDLNEKNPSLITTITIYMNNSPCSSKDHTCAMELIKFLNENVHIMFNIVCHKFTELTDGKKTVKLELFS